MNKMKVFAFGAESPVHHRRFHQASNGFIKTSGALKPSPVGAKRLMTFNSSGGDEVVLPKTISEALAGMRSHFSTNWYPDPSLVDALDFNRLTRELNDRKLSKVSSIGKILDAIGTKISNVKEVWPIIESMRKATPVSKGISTALAQVMETLKASVYAEVRGDGIEIKGINQLIDELEEQIKQEIRKRQAQTS